VRTHRYTDEETAGRARPTQWYLEQNLHFGKCEMYSEMNLSLVPRPTLSFVLQCVDYDTQK